MPFETLVSALFGLGVLVGCLGLASGRRLSDAMATIIETQEAVIQRRGVEPERPRLAQWRERAVAALTRASRGRRTPEELAKRLKWAGIGLAPAAWQTLPVVLAVLGGVLGALLGVFDPGNLLAFALAGMAAGPMIPPLLLKARLRRRKRHIARDILTYTEYLAMAMQSGADFRLAVAQVMERFPGPVAEAFATALLSANLAGRLDEGLLAVRSELQNPDVDVVVDTLVRNLQFGSRVAGMLLDVVQSVRKERIEKVMERASRAALLLLLPIAVFILPVVFGIVVFPMVGQAVAALH